MKRSYLSLFPIGAVICAALLAQQPPPIPPPGQALAHAPGGAFGYVVNGKMIGGFALVAWPAEYGVSGIRTLIINHDGLVYEKDLGPATAEQARRITRFNPDKSWRPTVLE